MTPCRSLSFHSMLNNFLPHNFFVKRLHSLKVYLILRKHRYKNLFSFKNFIHFYVDYYFFSFIRSKNLTKKKKNISKEMWVEYAFFKNEENKSFNKSTKINLIRANISQKGTFSSFCSAISSFSCLLAIFTSTGFFFLESSVSRNIVISTSSVYTTNKYFSFVFEEILPIF